MRFDVPRLVRQVLSAVPKARRTPSPVRERAVPATRTSDTRVDYAPSPNGRPDPGEVVWAWVPYEEDETRGKDRPVLVLAVDGDTVHALQMTSRDHDRDAAAEARAGRYWMDVGSGAWDSRGRPSEVRLNRLLTLDANAVRREGAALPRPLFDRVKSEAERFLAAP